MASLESDELDLLKAATGIIISRKCSFFLYENTAIRKTPINDIVCRNIKLSHKM